MKKNHPPVKFACALALCLLSGAVFAHPGHAENQIAAGLLHPLTGIDHLLAMLAVGLWAGHTGGAARWQLPLAFLGAMGGGWLLGLAGVALPGRESAIAASLLAFGLVLALRADLPRTVQLALTALFALCHGHAHGVELSAGAALGFFATTAALHGAGLGIAALLPGNAPIAYRAAGTGFAMVGTALLLG